LLELQLTLFQVVVAERKEHGLEAVDFLVFSQAQILHRRMHLLLRAALVQER
jgi:hypothetical protein